MSEKAYDVIMTPFLFKTFENLHIELVFLEGFMTTKFGFACVKGSEVTRGNFPPPVGASF